ncbi:LPS-assembly protein LptD [Pedobacter sp. MC2016-14]|uniref:putative LPS assembly protein LptD n=1 Tax=Pedobacter sp. MC2016-14 TaxID=2897327 RepID=UPI001E5FA685|nr:putative LPS assembly protein LptD [Pedobacter sp. MC2016-14]MCD0489629.1 LPS-assembly protein LptD [Pedobacter sp. MC2016-14]
MKLLQAIILITSFLLLTTVGNSVYAFQVPQQQDTSKKDTTKAGKIDSLKANPKGQSGLDAKVEYSAVDSTIHDYKSGTVYLYGKARVIYNTFELDADFIRYNSKNNTIFASGLKDQKGRYSGKPIFKMGAEGSSVADSLSYNTKTGKGNVYNTFTEQEGGFFSGGQSKKQPDDEIHVKNMIYSTCNLPHPHFGIFITKGIVAEKQIITGPVYFEIEDIPIPLGLPFAIFPKPNKKTSGFILPTPGEDATRGFFLQNGGYYMGINDYVDAKILGTIYTRGSYDATLSSNYTKRYKYTGNLNFAYSSMRFGLEGTPEYEPRKDFHVNWTHSQNANANPGSTFSASVNAGTSSYNLNTAGGSTYDPRAISANSLSSSISYSKTAGIFNLTVSANHSQETASKTVSLTLPNVNLSMTSINPFDSKDRVGEQKWFQKFNLGYNLAASNTVSTTEDLLFDKNALKRFQNGVTHNVTMSLPFTLAKYFNFSLSAPYTEQWHFQTLRQTALKRLNRTDSIAYDTIPGFKRSGEYNISGSVSTKIYNTLQFKNTGKIQAARHVMTPSVGFSYRPDFSQTKYGYYQNLTYQDGTEVFDPTYGRQKKYSIFQGSPYSGPGEGESASINFSLDNTVELKVLSSKDTTGSGTKKIPILQGLNFSGSYNFLSPKYKLSNIGFSGRSQFTDKLGINFNGTLNPYAVGDTTINGFQTKQVIDVYTFKLGKLPRLTSFGFSFDYSLNPEALKRRNQNGDKLKDEATRTGITPEQQQQLNAISRDPNAFVDFNIPWNFSFAYSFQYRTDDTGLNATTSNTVTFNGDFNATPNWKIQFNSGYDIKTKSVSMTNISIYRDLHCWDMSFNWVPFGTYKSYSVTLKVKASILQDLKLSKQQAFYTRY